MFTGLLARQMISVCNPHAEEWPAAPAQSMSVYSQGVLGGGAGDLATPLPPIAGSLPSSSAGSVQLSADGWQPPAPLSDAACSVYDGGSDVGSATSGVSAESRGSADWRARRRALQRPKDFSARDRFLLQERARCVFTMQAWQAQTEDLMRMAVN